MAIQTTKEVIRQLQQVIQTQQLQVAAQSRFHPVIGVQSVQNAAVVGPGASNTQGVVHNIPSTSGTGDTGAATKPPSPDFDFSYKVKIINPNKKSDVVVRQLNRLKSKFKSVRELRMRLIDDFSEHVPNTVDFTIGYFDGSQQAKTWLVSSDDLETMYQKYPKGGNIMFWCDAKSAESESTHTQKRKRDAKDGPGRRQEREEEVESTYKELVEKHSGKFDTPRLRLWARMMCSGLHDDFDNPPNVPAFSGNTPKRPRRESLSEAISGAAVAIAETIKGSSPCPPPPQLPTGISPGKAVDLRMKNFEQLRFLQKLYEDGILSEHEFLEQKGNILSSLRKL